MLLVRSSRDLFHIIQIRLVQIHLIQIKMSTSLHPNITGIHPKKICVFWMTILFETHLVQKNINTIWSKNQKIKLMENNYK